MNASTHAPITPERIMQLAWGYATPLILESAIRNRVFDVLDSGPQTLQQVSAETGASERGLAAIMNALCGLNFLSRLQNGAAPLYSLTPESSAFLVRSKPTFMGGLLLHTSEHILPKWLNLREIVATGRPAQAVNQQKEGAAFFEQFVEDIFPMSYPSAQQLAQELAFKDDPEVQVLDLAAGSGVWSIALAQSSPRVRVTAVDWPDVLPVTQRVAARFGVADRYRMVAGDLATADFGSGHAVATLGHILHSEGEERSRALLKKTFAALAPGGTIAIAEFLVNNDRNGPLTGLFFAVNMLVNTEHGGTYSFEEIGTWLAEAGFVNVRTLATPGPSPLILADKPGVSG